MKFWKRGMGLLLAMNMGLLCFFPQQIYAEEVSGNLETQSAVQTEETATTETTETTEITAETAETTETVTSTTAAAATTESAAKTTASAATTLTTKAAGTKSTAATMTATQSKKKKTATIRLNKSKKSLEKGKTFQLKAKVRNSSTKKIIWKSSKKKVATVSKNGVVTAKGKGKTTITATISGTNIKAKCKVTVKNYITMTVRTTGYCNCASCAGQWAGSATACGKMPRANHTIAVDRNLIKLGTKVQIGNTMYVAEDTGGAIKGKRIDIYYSSHSKAMAHGVKYQKIKVYI